MKEGKKEAKTPVVLPSSSQPQAPSYSRQSAGCCPALEMRGIQGRKGAGVGAPKGAGVGAPCPSPHSCCASLLLPEHRGSLFAPLLDPSAQHAARVEEWDDERCFALVCPQNKHGLWHKHGLWQALGRHTIVTPACQQTSMLGAAGIRASSFLVARAYASTSGLPEPGDAQHSD